MERQNNIKKLSTIISEKIAKTIEISIYNFAKEYSETNETPFLIDSIYSDKFTEKQHKYGPFEPIAEAKKLNEKTGSSLK
jgi:hypothetical protein